ncbi:MAG: PP2C family protein-serine/threonine phosphatase, partial [Rhodospirillaceae bacterium]
EGEEIARVALVQSRADLWLTIGATLLAFVAVIIAMLVLIIRRSIRLTERLIFLPLQSLETAASRMAAGNLEQKLDTSGDDEIASLTRSLDAMRGSISSLFGKLNHANQELSSQNHVLEEKVRERTVELERLNARLNSENIRMGAELDVTRQLQEMVLPREDELSTIEGLEISTHVEPAHEVGGDYLDVLSEGGRVRIGIGDVTGHGLDSGVLMLLTQSAVRTLNASEEADLLKIVNVLNRSLTGNINRMGSGKNLSFALLDYHLEQGPAGTQGLLNIVGQHESILICRANGTLEEIDTLMLGMPLGLVDDVGEYLAQEQIILAPGDIAVLYTDGITEAADAKGTLFGMPQLQQAVVDNHALSAPEIKQAVVARVKEHIGDQELLDDLTLLIIKQAEVAAAA